MSDRETNILWKIGSLIPGFNGYSERSDKRISDRIFREHNAKILERCERSIIGYQQLLLNNEDQMLIIQWESSRKVISNLIPKVRYAPYGESSFFSKNKIKENELDKIYEFDLSISENINIILLSIESYVREELSPLLILKKVSEIESQIDNRNQYISSYK